MPSLFANGASERTPIEQHRKSGVLDRWQDFVQQRQEFCHGQVSVRTIPLSQGAHVDVTSIEVHAVVLSFDGFDHVDGKMDPGELLNAFQTTWAEDVDFHELFANDVQADRKHAVLNEFGPHDFGNVQSGHIPGLQIGLGRRDAYRTESFDRLILPLAAIPPGSSP